MTGRKGDFGAATRLILAKRAGFRCSFPNCGAPTSGPSDETDRSVSDTGMACHIIAASDGPAARRVKPEWTAEQLSDVSNGIWMCHTHGKLIDTDEAHYTPALLRKWRELSELRARLCQQLQKDVELTPEQLVGIPLPDYCTEVVGLGPNFGLIADAVEASCMPQVWGQRISRAIRDVLIEVAQNALTHGSAKTVKLQILPKSIVLIDDGNAFDPFQLKGGTKRGGSLAITLLLNGFGTSLFHAYRQIDGTNVLEFSMVTSQREIRDLTRCSVDVPMAVFWNHGHKLSFPKECKRIYLMFPPIFALSWALQIPDIVAQSAHEGQEVILVGECLSEGAIDILRHRIPDIEIINFERSRH